MRKTFLAVILIAGAAYAAEEREIFRFREPVTVAEGTEVTNVVAVGSSILINGTVKENAVALGGDIQLGSTAVVQGDVVAVAGRVLQAPGSHVAGKLTSMPFSMQRVRRAIAMAIPTLILGLGTVIGAAIVLGSIGSVALAVLVLLLFPDQTKAVRMELEAHPWKTFLFGFLAAMLAVPILVFLTITLIGIPLAFVVAALLMAALVLGTVGVGQWLGYRAAEAVGRPLHPVMAGLVGLLLLTVISAIPFIGVLAQGLIACLALGCVGYSKFRGLKG